VDRVEAKKKEDIVSPSESNLAVPGHYSFGHPKRENALDFPDINVPFIWRLAVIGTHRFPGVASLINFSSQMPPGEIYRFTCIHHIARRDSIPRKLRQMNAVYPGHAAIERAIGITHNRGGSKTRFHRCNGPKNPRIHFMIPSRFVEAVRKGRRWKRANHGKDHD